MNISAALAVFAATTLLAQSAYATITLQFSLGITRIASNFANAGGVATDGMNWGIIIDTNSNGFDLGSYAPFTIGSALALSTGAGPSDDYYVPAPTTTADTSAFTETSTGAAGGHGTITIIPNVPFGTNGISLNDPFILVWFASNGAAAGDKYGAFSNAAFLVPSDGSTTDMSAPFAGADPLRLADLTIIPEPSSLLAMLSGAVTIGCARRGRRGERS